MARDHGGVESVAGWNRVLQGVAHRLVDQPDAARARQEEASTFFRRVGVPSGEIQAQLELATIDADVGRGGAASKRLERIVRRYPLGQGPFKNSVLTARWLTSRVRVLLDQGGDVLPEAQSLLIEAESHLVGRRIRDLETAVRELKRRLRRAEISSNVGPPHAKQATPQAVDSQLERSIRDAVVDLVRRIETEVGGEWAQHGQRLIDEFDERLRESQFAIEEREEARCEGARAEDLTGRTPAMREVVAAIVHSGRTQLPVLISGETGTGKELVAEAIHTESSRAQGPFVSIDCAALPEALLESELFGYVRGAFSGADADKPGLIASANGGTLLFDGIAEIPLRLQAKLLRVFDRKTVRPIGSDEGAEVDVRYLFSTQSDLGALVDNGVFRADLYFRMRAFEIQVPALRNRLEDVPDLVDLFRREAGQESETSFTTEALRALADYPWPGNVRELRNVVTRLVVTHDGIVDAESVRRVLGDEQRGGTFSLAQLTSRPLDQLLEQLEREYLVQLRRDCGGDLKTMAAKLGITLRALYGRFKRLGVSPRQ